MKNVLALVLIVFVAWFAYSRYQLRARVPSETSQPVSLEASPGSQFKCDGRTHCSQMTSCEEATFFLKNCPGTTMDGDNDGIPCERQWCN